jgi:anti-anti-sigma regulatory factor
MLRITVTQESNTTSMKLEGSIRGPWVGELEESWKRIAKQNGSGAIQIDLSAVSFADCSGRKVLFEMKNEGAILMGASTFLSHLIKEKTESAGGDVPEKREN